METGTLKELNVKPGDVVQWIFADGNPEGTHYTIREVSAETCLVVWTSDDEGVDEGIRVNRYAGKYSIISRAQPAATPDLTAITTPFGLLDEATQGALRAHGGPYEMWDGDEWDEGIPSWYGDCTYRVKPSSVIETVTLYGWPDQFLGNTTGAEPLIMTYQTFDGEPDWSTLKVEPR